jgi:hypothetical protein
MRRWALPAFRRTTVLAFSAEASGKGFPWGCAGAMVGLNQTSMVGNGMAKAAIYTNGVSALTGEHLIPPTDPAERMTTPSP